MKSSPIPVTLTGVNLVTANENHLLGVFSLMFTLQNIKISPRYVLLQRLSKTPAELLLAQLREHQKSCFRFAAALSAIAAVLGATLLILLEGLPRQYLVACIAAVCALALAIYAHFCMSQKTQGEEERRIALLWNDWKLRFDAGYFFSMADIGLLKSINLLLEKDCAKCALSVSTALIAKAEGLFRDLIKNVRDSSVANEQYASRKADNYTILGRELGLSL